MRTSESYIYPNPTSDYLYLRLNTKIGVNNSSYYLANILGQQIKLESISTSSNDEEIKFDLNLIQNGIYLLYRKDGNGEVQYIDRVNVLR